MPKHEVKIFSDSDCGVDMQDKLFPTTSAVNWPWASCQIRNIAPGKPGTLSPPLWVSDPDMHHGTWVTLVQFYVSSKRRMRFQRTLYYDIPHT